ncbi:MAG: hypothetical protein IPL49_19240 [Saprospirales bacterium]|nr:hypothetical protein [Saprospirales bacterium]
MKISKGNASLEQCASFHGYAFARPLRMHPLIDPLPKKNFQTHVPNHPYHLESYWEKKRYQYADRQKQANELEEIREALIRKRAIKRQRKAERSVRQWILHYYGPYSLHFLPG